MDIPIFSSVSTPVRNGDTPAKTPRTARKMSKVTTLPVLSESSPSHEETGKKNSLADAPLAFRSSVVEGEARGK